MYLEDMVYNGMSDADIMKEVAAIRKQKEEERKEALADVREALAYDLIEYAAILSDTSLTTKETEKNAQSIIEEFEAFEKNIDDVANFVQNYICVKEPLPAKEQKSTFCGNDEDLKKIFSMLDSIM